jgi:hypothetical protein
MSFTSHQARDGFWDDTAFGEVVREVGVSRAGIF